MAEELNIFELPRKDWHDNRGRIFKDALIENFNSIENKLNEITQLDPVSTPTLDWSKISVEDCSLDSDDTHIVNLKSFVNIMQLQYVPIKINFSGTRCVELMYYNNNSLPVTIKDEIVSGLGTAKPYLFIRHTDDKLLSAASLEALGTDTYTLIAVFDNGSVIPTNYCDIDMLSMLSTLPYETQTFQWNSRNYDEHGGTHYLSMNGRTRVRTNWNTRGSSRLFGTFFDWGRKGVKNR